MVGAGLSGLAAAHTLARRGARVVVLERGEFPGTKNLMGGVLYARPMEEVFPGWEEEAPLERPIVRQEYWLLSPQGGFRLGLHPQRWVSRPNAYTVLRARFDAWLASRVERAGAVVVPETLVVDLLREGERVVGVRTDRPEGDLRARMVIIAEGVNRFLVQKAGLGGEFRPREVALGVKQVISLPQEVIEERFGVRDREGVAVEMIGQPTEGMVGAAFLYTNLESVSLGLGVLVHQMVERKRNPLELLEELKGHPAVAPFIEGGEVREYGARLIPEPGPRSIPRLYGEGCLVVGDAAMLSNAVYREGSNFALISGKLAAETAWEALEKGDFSSRTLSSYRERLESSFILPDLRKFSRVGELFESHPEFFRVYPSLLVEALSELLTVDLLPKVAKRRLVLSRLRRERSLWRLGRDLFRLGRALG